MLFLVQAVPIDTRETRSVLRRVVVSCRKNPNFIISYLSFLDVLIYVLCASRLRVSFHHIDKPDEKAKFLATANKLSGRN